MKRRGFCLAAAAASLGAPNTVLAEAWPERPVRLVLSQPPGAGTDAIARMVTEPMGRRWGQPVVVDNKPGGQNAIGAQAAARSAADGYNFYFGTLAALVTNVYLFKSLPYDPRRDFVPVGMVGRVPFVVAVNAASPHRNLADLAAAARSRPGALAIADEGPKTFSGMVSRVLAKQLGVQVNPVPYVSTGAGLTDTIGGRCEGIVCDHASAVPMVRNGRLRLLAMTSSTRVAGWESVPLVSDLLPGFDYAGWLAIVAPTGTPAPAIERFNRDLDAVLRDKDMSARIASIGPVTDGASTPEQLGAFMQAEYARWARVVREIGVEPD